ncbi:hypothetical protein RJT34_05512 [Clitoria ternatea]|uniref:Receptor-like serine/threonine-protein kinase n=1 Tax=Clitoria ternatea TaxID=43366 RepID=A0AAN9K326_CLITE
MAKLTHLILTLLFLQFSSVLANIDQGSTLNTNNNESWRSPSGDFAFGFRQVNDTSTNNTSLFMVAIWYDTIPEKTIVWSAINDNNILVTASTGSVLQLTSQGLTLTTPQEDYIWIAKPKAEALVSNAAILDTGNFVLYDANSDYVWQSFNFPTDTLLPNQTLQADAVLTSRFSERNYTSGKFQLYFQDGNVLMSSLAWPSTYRYPSYNVINASGNASRLVFDQTGDIYVEISNGTRTQPQGPTWGNLTLDPKVKSFYRATIDFYGSFTQYVYSRNSTGQQGWRIVRFVPNDTCDAIFYDLGGGSCGYNSYCFMENQRPTCRCPYGYLPVDPSNEFGGCQPNFTIGCGPDFETLKARSELQYEFQVLRNVNFPLGDYERMEPYSADECKTSCLQDCACAVAILGGDTCWKKRLPLTNGRLVQDNVSHFVFVKTTLNPLANSYPGELPSGPDSKKNGVLLGLLIGSVVINSILLATVVLVLLLKPKVKRVVQIAAGLLETNLHSFTYEALREATWDFSVEIGRGSFGIVYKGQLDAVSCNMVAVKRLDRLAQEREKEFRTELGSIGKTCHKNLVRLIGFCDEGSQRLLVYEFMNNGTLADILFGKLKPTWNQRVGFALGIARGLLYLHEECDTPIIHCDIKPQNILIDDHFNAKISDFGLAKLLLSEQSRTNTMIRGTRGYVAPEWFKNVPITVKVDVYSFGVMLLEIICCRRNVLMVEEGEEEKAILEDWAYDCYMEGRIEALVENDKEAMANIGRLKSWVKIGIWCIQEHNKIRPTMGMVIQMLEGFVKVPDPPPPRSFN